MKPFEIEFLDHVALRCKDPERSAAWYEQALGLTRYQIPEWTPYPIFLLAGKTGIALFPAQADRAATSEKSVRIDHFAFQVDAENFERAKAHLDALQISFEEQDHTYFRSLYCQDPDGHTVELTVLQVPSRSFYKD